MYNRSLVKPEKQFYLAVYSLGWNTQYPGIYYTFKILQLSVTFPGSESMIGSSVCISACDLQMQYSEKGRLPKRHFVTPVSMSQYLQFV